MVSSSTLTIAQASGLIAAGIVIVRLLLPNLLVLSFLGTLKEKNGAFTTNAISWSVIGKELHSSLWPTFLRSDSTASRGVLRTVNYTKWIEMFATILAAVAAIMTPLGLYDDIVPAGKPILRAFHTIQDTGIFGLGSGTQPRNSSIGWSRICGAFSPYPCPGSETNITFFSNATGEFWDITGPYYTTIPQKYIDLFQSGVDALGESVSGPFDIQWRSLGWSLHNDLITYNISNFDNLTTYPVGVFRTISTLVLNNRTEVIEGLVVDTVQGGIGFRNHTAPPMTTYGSTWQEDLLFIEPVTQCVDLNLTWDYEMIEKNSQLNNTGLEVTPIANLRLVDHGGFVNINRTYPEWNRTDTQGDPQLWQRAYKAAWLNNVYSMAYFNVTPLHNESDPSSPHAFQYLNSTLGKEFNFTYPDGRAATLSINFSPQAFSTILWGYYLDQDLDKPKMNSTFANFTTNPNPTIEEPALFPNPFNVSWEDLSDVNVLCEGAGGLDYANITNFAASCSLVLGVPRRKDGVDDLMGLPGSSWTTPMYSCISVARAVIKTVTFTFNSTDTVSGLSVINIQPKIYENRSSMPIWAVENTLSNLSDVAPLWGIVSPDHDNTANLSTIQRESLILPGLTALGALGQSYQNLPATDAITGALTEGTNISPSPLGQIDYTGLNNLAMFRRWQNLSSSADSTGTIFNLIITDLLANALIGTKSLAQSTSTSLRKRDDSSTNPMSLSSQYGVTPYQRKIKYHMPYAIPGIILLALLLVTLLVTFFAVGSGRTSAGKMRRYLNATSAGRLMTLRAGVGKDDEKSVSTSSWIDTDGRARLSAGHGSLSHVDADGHDEGGTLLKRDDEDTVQVVESQQNREEMVKDTGDGSVRVEEVASPT